MREPTVNSRATSARPRDPNKSGGLLNGSRDYCCRSERSQKCDELSPLLGIQLQPKFVTSDGAVLHTWRKIYPRYMRLAETFWIEHPPDMRGRVCCRVL